jgi:hypothetical protein
MNKDVEGLLRELIRLKDILERMPTAFASINTNLSSGEKYVAGHQWIWWGKFSAPLSRRCPAASGLQFPPFLLMDALLQRKRYDSFLGREGLHLHAWLPTNLRALSLQLRITTAFPTSISRQETPGSWAFGKETWKRTRVKGFLGAHRYKVFGILGIASKTGRTETNGLSGAPDKNARPWEVTHKQFSEAIKERLEPYRGEMTIEPHEIRGTFEECRYRSRILSRSLSTKIPTGLSPWSRST